MEIGGTVARERKDNKFNGTKVKHRKSISEPLREKDEHHEGMQL